MSWGTPLATEIISIVRGFACTCARASGRESEKREKRRGEARALLPILLKMKFFSVGRERHSRRKREGEEKEEEGRESERREERGEKESSSPHSILTEGGERERE